MKDIFDLTEGQQRAFNRLKKAYKDCTKEGILFINNYGALQAVDKKIISGYGDSTMTPKGIFELSTHEAGSTHNSISIANEWADDEHLYGLTELGLKIYLDK